MSILLSSQVPVEVHDVVQLDPAHCRWGAIFVVVTEVRSWGIQGWFPVPRADDQTAHSYIRAKHGEYVRVGRAAWTMGDGSGTAARGDDT